MPDADLLRGTVAIAQPDRTTVIRDVPDAVHAATYRGTATRSNGRRPQFARPNGQESNEAPVIGAPCG